MRELPPIKQRLIDAGWSIHPVNKMWQKESGPSYTMQIALNALDTMPLLTEMQVRHDEAEAEIQSLGKRLAIAEKKVAHFDEMSESNDKYTTALAHLASVCDLPAGTSYKEFPGIVEGLLAERCTPDDYRDTEKKNAALHNTVEALEGVLVSMARGNDASRSPLHCGWCGALIPKHGPRTCDCMDGKERPGLAMPDDLRIEALEAQVKALTETSDVDAKAISSMGEHVDKLEENAEQDEAQIRHLGGRVDKLEASHTKALLAIKNLAAEQHKINAHASERLDKLEHAHNAQVDSVLSSFRTIEERLSSREPVKSDKPSSENG